MGYANVMAICLSCILAIVSVGSGVPRMVELVGDAAAAGILVVYFCIVVQMLVAYWKVCQVSPGRPVEIFGNIDTYGEAQRPVMTVNGKELKLCYKCNSYKPDRCHHCSDCEQCTLRMDHHCPWVNNCIGFRNYKYFFLFLTYSTLSCCFTIGLLVWLIVTRGHDSYWAWDIMYVITCAVVGLFLCGALGLLAYHSLLMTSNQTTIEQLKHVQPHTFSIGCFSNIQQVLGSNPLLWCCPCVWGVSEDFDGVQWDHPKERLSGIVSSPPFSPHTTANVNINGTADPQDKAQSLYPPYGPHSNSQLNQSSATSSYNSAHPLSLAGLGFPEKATSGAQQGQEPQQHTSSLSYEPGWQNAAAGGGVRQVKLHQQQDFRDPRPPPRAVAYSINPPIASQDDRQGLFRDGAVGGGGDKVNAKATSEIVLQIDGVGGEGSPDGVRR